MEDTTMNARPETQAAIEDYVVELSQKQLHETLQQLGLRDDGNRFNQIVRIQQWLLGNYTATDFVEEEGSTNEVTQSRVTRRDKWIDRTLGAIDDPTPEGNNTSKHPLVTLLEDAGITTSIVNVVARSNNVTTRRNKRRSKRHTNNTSGQESESENDSNLSSVSTTTKENWVRLVATNGEPFQIPSELATVMADLQQQIRDLNQSFKAAINQPWSSTAKENDSQHRHVGFQDTFTCHYDEQPTANSSTRQNYGDRVASGDRRPTGSHNQQPARRHNEDYEHEQETNPSSWQSSRSSMSSRDIGNIVRKWQIRFSGEKSQSIEVFLARVEDYRIAANLTDEQLLPALSELFTGWTATWYQNHKQDWSCWDDFVETATRWFGTSSNYQQKLVEEATARTQDPNETVSEYMTALMGIMKKQRPVPSEKRQIDLMHRNMLIKLQRQVKRAECTSIARMLELAREAEMVEEREKTYRPPPDPEASLLPEMAFKGRKKQSSTEAGNKASSDKTKPAVAAVNANQVTREADALTKISQILETLVKQTKGNGQSNQGQNRKYNNKSSDKDQKQEGKGSKDSSNDKKGDKGNKPRRQFDPTKPLACDDCGKLGYMRKFCPDCNSDKKSGNEQKGG